MSYDSFIENLMTQMKTKVIETINTKVSKSCISNTTNTQNKYLQMSGLRSHFTSDVYYDPNIDCSSDIRICGNYKSMVCSKDTKKCIPACKISQSQNQQINVSVNCIGEQQSLVSSTSTTTTDVTKNPSKSVSSQNLQVQSAITTVINEILGDTIKPDVIQKISNVFIKSVSDSNISQKCASNILVVQDQNIVLSGDIYCTPDSVINIDQNSNIANYINCVFSDAKQQLLASPELAQAYKQSLKSDCICDKKILNGCDRKTNTRKVSYTVLKPATGGGVCDCPVQTTQESCNLVFSSAVCVPSAWTEWSECKDGFQNRIRRINFGTVECAQTSQQRPCKLTMTLILQNTGQQFIKNIKWIGLFFLICMILIFIWLF